MDRNMANRTELEGYISDTPQLRYITKSNTPVVSFTVCHERARRDAVPAKEYYSVAAFGDYALISFDGWEKGQLVKVVGKLGKRIGEADKPTWGFYIRAESVEILEQAAALPTGYTEVDDVPGIENFFQQGRKRA